MKVISQERSEEVKETWGKNNPETENAKEGVRCEEQCLRMEPPEALPETRIWM